MKRTPRSHLLHKFSVVGALIIVLAGQACLAFDPNEWRNRQVLEIPAKGLVRVNVPAATLDAAQPGLEDLRIVDSTGNQVPYLIERLLPDAESTMRPAEFRSAIENGATRLNLKTGTSAPIVGVSLETPATRFMKAADVEGSNDGVTWEKLAGELVKAERSTVTAGPEQNLSAKPLLVGQTLTGSTRYIFWGTLALVVIVLLTIMSRFLPKQQQQ